MGRMVAVCKNNVLPRRIWDCCQNICEMIDAIYIYIHSLARSAILTASEADCNGNKQPVENPDLS